MSLFIAGAGRHAAMNLTGSSEVLMRNLGRVAASRVLVCNSPGGEIAPYLAEGLGDGRIVQFHTDYADYLRARQLAAGAAGLEVSFGAWYERLTSPHDLAILYLPKSVALLELMLDMVGGALARPARLWLVGPTRGGIRSAADRMVERFGPVEKLDSARRCALYEATVERAAEATTDLRARQQRYTFEIGGSALDVYSNPGVFSHGRLDDGTRLLLETLNRLPESPVLDFGCGCGVIGAWIHERWPGTRVDMVDASALALAAAQRTAQQHDMPQDCVFASDVFSDVTGRYALVITNPPFHLGVETDYAVVDAFMQGCGRHLVDGGVLRLVANRFLRYPGRIRENLGTCQIVAENTRYRVYEAVWRQGGRSRS